MLHNDQESEAQGFCFLSVPLRLGNSSIQFFGCVQGAEFGLLLHLKVALILEIWDIGGL